MSCFNCLGFNLRPFPTCPLHQHLLNRHWSRTILLSQKICRWNVHIRRTGSGRILSRPRMWLKKLNPLCAIDNIVEKQHERITRSYSPLLFLE